MGARVLKTRWSCASISWFRAPARERRMPTILWLAALPATPLRARRSTLALTKQNHTSSRAAKNCAKSGKRTLRDPSANFAAYVCRANRKNTFPSECAANRPKIRARTSTDTTQRSQRFQELDDGVLLRLFQFFKLLDDMAGL